MKIDIDSDRIVHTYIDWDELVNKYKGLFAGKDVMANSIGKNWQTEIKKGLRTDFYSCDGKTMIDRIRNGYSFPDIDLANIPTVTYDRPRPRFTDDPEGEFDNDMFDNGETEYFLSKPKKKSVGGIRMKVQIGFTGVVPDEIITEYFIWVGQTIQAIQARGYDIELSVFNRNTRLYPNYRDSFQNIRISKFGEKVMPSDWSALFSPGGHRHFMFLLYQWAGDEKEIEYSSSYGCSIGKGWGLKWNKESKTLIINTNSSASSFPADQLTKEFDGWKD